MVRDAQIEHLSPVAGAFNHDSATYCFQLHDPKFAHII